MVDEKFVEFKRQGTLKSVEYDTKRKRDEEAKEQAE